MNPRDTTSPVVMVSDLVGTNLVREIERTLSAAGLSVASTATRDQPATLRLRLERVAGGIEARGEVEFAWEGECRRCLEPVTGVTTAPVEELFEAVPTEGESYLLDENRIDLRELLRDAVLLNLPLAPLCSDSCAGPQPGEFPVSVEDDAAAEPLEPPLDPRWAALDVLREPPTES